MPRKSFVPGAALLVTVALAAGLTGCSGGSATGTSGGDGKGGDATAASPSAQPGRYQTLPEACGLPSRGTLRAMLPGDDQQLSQADAQKIYGGRADITYDTDRRVGCQWTRETTAGTRHLTLDIQRVVSYNAAVSDDDRAQELYLGKEQAAKIPSAGSDTPSASASPKDAPKGQQKPSAGATDANGGQDAAAGGKKADGAAAATSPPATPSGSPSATPSDPTTGAGSPLAPRVLDGLGDAAFLNDQLITTDSGVHRDITVVFRTSNVIVTLTYDQWSTDKTQLPESQELQDKARSLAGELADSLSE
ncbi:hypothetical protein SAZ_20895 [Streptomyces noursei ZPM]|uniref:DUF3558 domain-containing protein n=1 Tax=Streptomyces noursei TaxID=1971 RepID=A0A401R327_STRNR|nr:hypothetical protein [Streptomyces noursei]AKA04645.1 hypothetical protein SAZ_20895 [Streptomyces noursei ZPM]EOT00771.1 hypothetical protein K530_27154 [Streptomyces noursei CCRC 11814]EXU90176.1 hypothetical protein P354_18325 [Streptomyces noursei PD-1]UWS73021.1 hypothetical protein N1H47_18250 [Streptomyces noursei]GCB92014.1 hypothetical protein SALB_04761 [Streptomyces noursei]